MGASTTQRDVASSSGISRTMAAALTVARTPTQVRSHASGNVVGSIQPRSPVEQYWAARALTAETLLSSRAMQSYEGHTEEVSIVD